MPEPDGGSGKSGEAQPRRCAMDVHIGSRIRLRRNLMFMTQERVGTALGCSFQQVQKYERGLSRIAAAKLYKLAQILQVPITFFFEDMPEALRGSGAGTPGGEMSPAAKALEQHLNQRETRDLVGAYYRIQDAALRSRILSLIESLTPSEETPSSEEPDQGPISKN